MYETFLDFFVWAISEPRVRNVWSHGVAIEHGYEICYLCLPPVANHEISDLPLRCNLGALSTDEIQ